MTFETRAFRPASWAAGPNAQTLLARVLRPAEGPHLERERLWTPDDDFLDLDWGPDPGPDAPIVLVLHGLEGSAKRRYMRNACAELLNVGIRPAALNFRGCSGESNRAPQFYHSGETDDPAFVLDSLRKRHPGRRIGALGFSLGGNILLKLMGERDDGGLGMLDAAAVISVPYDLAAGCALLERSLMGRIYTTYFLRSLQAKVKMKETLLGGVLDLDAAMAARTIREFDDRVTAPLHGFAGAAEYYSESSGIRYLGGVRVPTLLLHAEDDPFLPLESIPMQEAGRSASLHLALQAHGGHVGFLEGPPWQPSFWAEVESARFLARRLLPVVHRPSETPSERAAKGL